MSINFAALENGAVMMDSASPTYFGPNRYDDLGTCAQSYKSIGMLCAGTGSDYDTTARPTRAANTVSTWYVGSTSTWHYAVIDLGASRTFNTALYFQSALGGGGEGRVTHATLDYMTSSPSGYADGGWTVAHTSTALSESTDAVTATFADVTAQYVRVGCLNDGSLSNDSYVELYSFKLFAVDAPTLAMDGTLTQITGDVQLANSSLNNFSMAGTLTQITGDIQLLGPEPTARVTQSVLLSVSSVSPDARVTQSVTLVVGGVAPPARVTQSVLMGVVNYIPPTRLTQSVLQVVAEYMPCVTYFAECWKITRTDDTVFAFTAHDMSVSHLGVTYLPCDSLIRGANESTSGSNTGNMDVAGVISDDAISEADIRKGLFRDALVEVWLIPWKNDGTIATRLQSGVVGKIEQGRSGFKFEVLTPLARLDQQPLLQPHKPGCRYIFGDAKCTFDISSITVTSAVDGEVIGPSQFHTFQDSTRTEIDGDFDFGTLTWLTGNNAGEVCEIKRYAGQIFQLWPRLSAKIEIGDTYSANPGCDFTPARCKHFSNYVNFGGFPDVPGQDNLIRTPNAKA